MQPGNAKKILVMTEPVIGIAGGGKGERNQKLGLVWPIKVRPHHSNDLIGLLIQKKRTADNSRIAAETAFPAGVRKDHLVIRTGLVFFGAKHAPQLRASPKNIEPLPRNRCSGETFRRGSTGAVIEGAAFHHGGGGENALSRDDVSKIGWR